MGRFHFLFPVRFEFLPVAASAALVLALLAMPCMALADLTSVPQGWGGDSFIGTDPETGDSVMRITPPPPPPSPAQPSIPYIVPQVDMNDWQNQPSRPPIVVPPGQYPPGYYPPGNYPPGYYPPPRPLPPGQYPPGIYPPPRPLPPGQYPPGIYPPGQLTPGLDPPRPMPPGNYPPGIYPPPRPMPPGNWAPRTPRTPTPR